MRDGFRYFFGTEDRPSYRLLLLWALKTRPFTESVGERISCEAQPSHRTRYVFQATCRDSANNVLVVSSVTASILFGGSNEEMSNRRTKVHG